jgi:hypothetical protein
MIELAGLISQYGFHVLAGGVFLYLLLRGEIRFRYPR